MRILVTLIDLYTILIVVAVILSWIRLDPRHPFAAVVHTLTEPVLRPIRDALPAIGGLDLSPMVLLIGLQVLKGLLV